MAETFGFYDTEELVDGTFDREYVAQQWADYFKLFIGTGVFASPTNQLKVVAGEGMNVIVKEGWAFIEGRWYHNDADLTIAVPPNMTVSTINSGIFVQASATDREIHSIIATGRTTPDRESPYYELKLAEIQIPTGTTAITNAMITDTRTDESVCGFVKGLLEGVIPTADLFLQFETQFMNWFNEMKDQLSEDAAGNLQLEIDGINETLGNLQTETEGLDTRISSFEDAIEAYTNGIGATSIKNIGDGTITGAIEQINTSLIDVSGSVSGILNNKEYKPSYRAINAHRDLLMVQLGQNDHIVNQPYYFSTDYGALTNLPSGAPSTFYGWREVKCVMSLTTVILHEMYPIYGRMWANTYDTNAGTWYGWKTIGGNMRPNFSILLASLDTDGTVTATQDSFLVGTINGYGELYINDVCIGRMGDKPVNFYLPLRAGDRIRISNYAQMATEARIRIYGVLS